MSTTNGPWGLELKTFLILMHGALLAGFVIPYAGMVLPFVMWIMNKDEYLEVHAHGRNIVNWIISYVIFSAISGFLVIIIIGVFFLFVLGILNLVFAIMGMIKASNGEVYDYPMSIQFIKD
jgi:uncharacterized Tic20 family protein